MLDIVESEIEFVGMGGSSTEFGTIVSEDGLDRQTTVSIEWEDVVMKHGNGAFRDLGCVEEPESRGAVGIHHGMQIHLLDAFEGSDTERVLAEKFAGTARFDMPFPETGICLLDQGDLFGRELDSILAVAFFESEYPIMPRPHPVVRKDLLHRHMTDPDAVESKKIRDAIAAPGRVSQAHGENPVHNLGRSGLRVSVVRGREIFQAGKPVQPKPPFPLVVTVPVHPLPAAGFGNIAQFFSKLENREAMMSRLLARVFRGHARRTHDGQHPLVVERYQGLD